MKHLSTYTTFLTEALAPSQFRKYVKAFKKDRYEELFQTYKQKYSGDRNAYRIYLPLVEKENVNPVEKEIAAYLETIDFKIVNYIDGTCIATKEKAPNPNLAPEILARIAAAKPKEKNAVKIGSILTKNHQEALMKKFVEDPRRKAGSDLLVCISRHPYDIAGSDTDRDWTNCMTLKSKVDSPRIRKILAEIKELKAKLKTVDPDSNQVDLITRQIEELEEDACDRKEAGVNAHYILPEIKAGSLISYLIRSNDKDLKKPLAVLNIKPFVSGDKKFMLMADRHMYGQGTPEFQETVNKWVEEVNGDVSGVFNQAPGTYSDQGHGTVTRIGKADNERITADAIAKIESGEITSFTQIENYNHLYGANRDKILAVLRPKLMDRYTADIEAGKTLTMPDGGDYWRDFEFLSKSDQEDLSTLMQAIVSKEIRAAIKAGVYFSEVYDEYYGVAGGEDEVIDELYVDTYLKPTITAAEEAPTYPKAMKILARLNEELDKIDFESFIDTDIVHEYVEHGYQALCNKFDKEDDQDTYDEFIAKTDVATGFGLIGLSRWIFYVDDSALQRAYNKWAHKHDDAEAEMAQQYYRRYQNLMQFLQHTTPDIKRRYESELEDRRQKCKKYKEHLPKEQQSALKSKVGLVFPGDEEDLG